MKLRIGSENYKYGNVSLILKKKKQGPVVYLSLPDKICKKCSLNETLKFQI